MKYSFNGKRCVADYDPLIPEENLMLQKKQLKGKQLKDLTQQEKDKLVLGILINI